MRASGAVSVIRIFLALSAFTRAWTQGSLRLGLIETYDVRTLLLDYFVQGFLLALAVETSYVVGDQRYFILRLCVLPLLVVCCLSTDLSALFLYELDSFSGRDSIFLFPTVCY